MPYKYFQPQQLTANEVNEYLMNQSVMVFASSAARASALTAPIEGMLTYRTDSDVIEFYNGSAWQGLATTNVTASGSVTATGSVTAASAVITNSTRAQSFQVYNPSTSTVVGTLFQSSSVTILSATTLRFPGDMTEIQSRIDATSALTVTGEPTFKFVSSRSGTNNFPTLLVQNNLGNHSWGIVANFRVNTAGGDRPSIQFSAAGAARVWTVGYGYTDDDFRIKYDHGYYNTGWGYTALRITNGINAYPRVVIAGTTDVTTADGTLIVNGIPSFYAAMTVRMPSSGGDNFVMIVNNNGTIGSITSPGGFTTSFNTSSDYRIKTDIVDLPNPLEVIQALRPRRFGFVASPDVVMAGFIAHEVDDVIPTAVHGEKDAVREDNGEIIPQQLDQTRMIPYLVGAVQQLASRLETLEETSHAT